jgi:hypothetical protein
VLVAHGSRRDAHWTVIERADERVDLHMEGGIGELLGEAPEFAATGDRRLIIKKHAVRIAAFAAAERDRNDLAGFGVVAEPRRIGHADELVIDRVAVGQERFRHDRPEFLRIGAIGDDEVLAVGKPVGTGRIGWARQWHREGALADLVLSHCRSL